MDLGQRQSRVLKMNLLRTPAIRDLVQNDLGDLHLRAANPGDALAVEFDLRGEDNGHGCSPGSSIRHEAQREPHGHALPPCGNFRAFPAVQSTMSMNIGGNGQKAQINVTPMIDVLLVLIIIFMVITPLVPRGLNTVVPPQADTPPPPEVIPRDIVIS